MSTKKSFRLNAPKKKTFWIAAAIGALGVILGLVSIFVSSLFLAIAVPVLLGAAWILVSLGCFMKGL
jgi:hypothetical protein